MTGFQDKRSVKQSVSVKRPAQSKPEGALPAKRGKRGAAAAATPRGREPREVKPKSEGSKRSAAAPRRREARAVRIKSEEANRDEAVPAAPRGLEARAVKAKSEEAKHDEAAPSVPLWRQPHALWTTPTLTVETKGLMLARTLRTRKIFVPDTSPLAPPQYKKGEEHVYDESWQTPACAEAALEHYNRFNEDKHELVKAVDSFAFFFNGLWMHANFFAELKGATNCVDLVPEFFFAELRIGPNEKGMSCVSCIKMDPADPKTAPISGCKNCPSRMYHPAAGGYRGSRVEKSYRNC